MKIAQVSAAYYPHAGGIETVVREVSERLAGRGFEIDILTYDPSGKLDPCEVISGVTVRRFRPGPWGWDFPSSISSLSGYLAENSRRYDLIHAHNYQSFPALFVARAKRENRMVFSPYYHGTGRNLRRTLLHTLYRRVGKTIFEKADRVICISQSEKALVQRHFSVPHEKMNLIPPGVNQEAIAKAKSLAFDGVLLLYVGRLDKYKNVDLAMKAMPYLPPEYRLVVIGDGSYKETLKQLARRLHLGDRVRMISGLSNEEVYRWYKTCNLVLLLSGQESFGLVVIEGLAAGKPVLVNNIGPLAELAAKFKQVYTVDATTLPSSELAKKIIQACAKKTEPCDLSEYSWDSVALKMENLYKSLC